MRSTIKKPKKAKFVENQQNFIVNSTLVLHEQGSLSKLAPSLKKYQSSEIAEDNHIKINDDGVYETLYNFLDRLIDDHLFYNTLLQSVQFQQISKADVSSQRSQQTQQQKLQKATEKCAENAAKKQRNHGSRRLSKKVSIFIDMSQNQSSSSSSMGSSKIFASKNNIARLCSLTLPLLELRPQLIKQIFIAPSLYLINLSLCLLLKYCYLTNTSLDDKNIGWILSISAIVAYKIYYDEQIEDLVECFEQVMKVDKKTIVDLERNFLQGLDYRAIISGKQYQYVVAKMLEYEKEHMVRDRA